MNKHYQAWTLYLVILTLTLSVFMPQRQSVAYAEVPTMDKIRVALFIDTGKYYRGTVPTVSLSSSGGLIVSGRLPDQRTQTAYLQTKDAKPVRFSLNQVRIVLPETTDLSKATADFTKLTENKFSPAIESFVRNGKTSYQLYLGPYASSVEAATVQDSLSMLFGWSTSLSGPYYLNAGSFAKLAEAEALGRKLTDAGFKASVAYTGGGSLPLSYQVWVGEAVDTAALQPLKQSLAAADANLAAVEADLKQPFLLAKMDFIPQSASQVPHYYFNSGGQALEVRPASAVQGAKSIPFIQVEERYDRKYRGMMELTSLNNVLTVINELPFEQYLYSVVGSEMAGGWPLEALKSQAVIARTYAVGSGMKYQIAHVSDTTFDQAYKGVGMEREDIIQAVDQTRGQLLTYEGKLVQATYYSNAGGKTAVGEEVWGGTQPYYQSVTSPDSDLLKSTPLWYRAVLGDGRTGYIHSGYADKLARKHPIGLVYARVTEDQLNVRSGPSTNQPVIGKLNMNDIVIVFEEVYQNNAYSWIEGPYTGEQIGRLIQSRTTTALSDINVSSLEVKKTGISDRVTAVAADGKLIEVRSPDGYRTVFGGLRSTRFKIEETAKFTVLGASGVKKEIIGTKGIYTAADDGGAPLMLSPQGEEWFVIDQQKNARVLTSQPQFKFSGFGFGHGLGLSQWGAKSLAERGYGYTQILKHYYTNKVEITHAEKQ